MTQSIAVAGAIANQLNNDNWWPPNDLNKIMGKAYHYDINTITNFLVAVRWHLAYGNPRYYFQFDTAFANAALGQSVGDLTGSVDAKTSSDPPPNWINP